MNPKPLHIVTVLAAVAGLVFVAQRDTEAQADHKVSVARPEVSPSGGYEIVATSKPVEKLARALYELLGNVSEPLNATLTVETKQSGPAGEIALTYKLVKGNSELQHGAASFPGLSSDWIPEDGNPVEKLADAVRDLLGQRRAPDDNCEEIGDALKVEVRRSGGAGEMTMTYELVTLWCCKCSVDAADCYACVHSSRVWARLVQSPPESGTALFTQVGHRR